MIRGCLLAVTIALCCLGSAAMAQNAPPHVSHKAHVKAVTASTDSSEDWSIAEPATKTKTHDVSQDPKVSEGRKKFFEQSTTMEDGGPAAATGANGFTPSVGFGF
jgi:hypothetical protein